MADTPMGPSAELVLVINHTGETAEVYFNDGHPETSEHKMIGMIGEVAMFPHLRWLASSAASFHGIPFTVEDV